MPTIRLLLADDQLLVRAGIRALVQTLPDCQVVAECADGREALEQARLTQPDVALLDIDMPGFSGIQVMAEIRRFAPAMKILVLSGIDRPDVVDAALAAGANGYLLKDFVLGELQLALATVMRDESYLSPKIQQQLISSLRTSRQGHPSGLTPRQQEILRLVASGRTTKEIARDLGISPKTVEFHRAQLMEKLGIHEVAGLTRYAMQQGLV